MNQFGITSNIMSLSGIAIAIGVLVDAGIVMAENAIRHCELAEKKKGARLNKAESLQVTLEAAQQVGRPIFFAMVIIILAFMPVFALSGQEGKLFHPLAFTKTFAMAGSTLLAITLVPALCATFIRGPFHAEDSNPLMKILLAIYNPILDWALRFRKTVLGTALILVSPRWFWPLACRARLLKTSTFSPQLAAKLPRGMGSEFMPTLNEGSLLFMPVLLPSTSLTEVKRIMAWQDQVIKPDARSRERRRQARPLRNRHRSRAHRNDRDDHHAQAGIAMASGHDQGKTRRRAGGKIVADARLRARIFAAD
jgi:copper/silver efflux system protein